MLKMESCKTCNGSGKLVIVPLDCHICHGLGTLPTCSTCHCLVVGYYCKGCVDFNKHHISLDKYGHPLGRSGEIVDLSGEGKAYG